jgi:hypothetical protein
MGVFSAKEIKLALGFGAAICVLLIGIGTTILNDAAEQHAAAALAEAATVPTPTSTPSTAHVATTTYVKPTPPKVTEPVPLTYASYIEVTDGCAAHFQGECLLVRSGPGKSYPVVSKLRTGVVLEVSDATTSADGITWYKVVFNEWLRYPERHKGTWYIAADYVTSFKSPVVPDFVPGVSPTTTKRITVNRTTQQLAAYDGKELFMTATTSTGLGSTPTPRGIFTIFKKTPSRYMQGPLPGLASDQYYDLPGVPWNLYFTEGGAVIHGAYWHTAFGTPYSHGCVNLSLEDAKKIYEWADTGTTVTVHD